MTTTVDPQVITAQVERLVRATEIGDFQQELAVAGNFVFRYGTLGDIFDEPDLTRAQFAGRQGSAWYLLGHWSVARNDPNSRPDATIEELMCHAGCEVCRFLEHVHGLRDIFEYERCHDCNGDIDVHAVVVDVLGLPHAMCVAVWQRTEPPVFAVDDLVAEQASDAWAARFAARLADGTWAVVTRTYYLAVYGGASGGQVTWLERNDHYQVCRDPSDPAGTQLAAAAATHEVDDFDPEREDPSDLATVSFEPEPGEWQTHIPDSAPFANTEGN